MTSPTKYIHLREISIHTFTNLQKCLKSSASRRGIPLLPFFGSLFRGAISRITFSMAVIADAQLKSGALHHSGTSSDVGASVVPFLRGPAETQPTNNQRNLASDCSNQHLNNRHRCLRTQTSHNNEGTAVCIAQYLWNECIRNPFVVEDPLPKT